LEERDAVRSFQVLVSGHGYTGGEHLLIKIPLPQPEHSDHLPLSVDIEDLHPDRSLADQGDKISPGGIAEGLSGFMTLRGLRRIDSVKADLPFGPSGVKACMVSPTVMLVIVAVTIRRGWRDWPLR
jgi:hypothetical protein